MQIQWQLARLYFATLGPSYNEQKDVKETVRSKASGSRVSKITFYVANFQRSSCSQFVGRGFMKKLFRDPNVVILEGGSTKQILEILM